MAKREPSSGRADDLLAGTHYRIVGEIGSGGHGVVYDVEHRELGSRAVAKVLRAPLARHPQLADRMRLEAQALARLDHPNLVAVRDFGQTTGGQPFFIMEKLRGRTLRQELAVRGPLPVADAVNLTRQALAGLAVAHAAGLVHRDIKLDNLFVCDPPAHDPAGARVLKVLDFGVAKVVDARDDASPRPLAIPTEQGVLVGTPRYLSPEQISEGPVDARTDLYAMGIVLYALLTAQSPYDSGNEFLDLVRAHAFMQPRPPSLLRPDIPRALEAVILRALQKEPAARFPSADAMTAALSAYDSLSPGAPRRGPAALPDTATEPLPPLAPEAAPQAGARGGAHVTSGPGLLSAAEEPTRAVGPALSARVLQTIARVPAHGDDAPPPAPATVRGVPVTVIARSGPRATNSPLELPGGDALTTRGRSAMSPMVMLALCVVVFGLVGAIVAGIIVALR